MTKVIVKYLLFTCVLLVSGYGLLSARPDKRSASHASFAVEQNIETIFIGHGRLSTKDQDHGLHVSVFENEEEDNKQFSFKKCLERASYASVFFSQVPDDLCNPGKRLAPVHGYFSHTSSPCRYLIFQVFRV